MKISKNIAILRAIVGIGLAAAVASQVQAQNLSGQPGATATGATRYRTLAAMAADATNVRSFGALGDNTTDDTAAIQAAITQAAASSRAVRLPDTGNCYMISAPLTVPLGLSLGALFGDEENVCIRATAGFSGANMLTGNAGLAHFRLAGLTFDANSVAGITTAISLGKSPEIAAVDKIDRVRVINLANGNTGINLDGSEDTTCIHCNISFAGGAHGVSIAWHVPGGDLTIQYGSALEPVKLSAQQASVVDTVTGGVYADGTGIVVLNLTRDYIYADTNLNKNDVGAISTAAINTLHVDGGYWNPNGQNSVVAVAGNFNGGGYNINNLSLDAAGATGYTLFGPTTTATGGATPNFLVQSPVYSSGASMGTPAAGVVATDPNAAWQTYTPTVSCGSGTLTSASASGRYQILGKTVNVSIQVSITTNGTCAALLEVGLPTNAGPGPYRLAGREDAINGKMLIGSAGYGAGGNNLFVWAYDASYPGGNGAIIDVSGIYERN